VPRRGTLKIPKLKKGVNHRMIGELMAEFKGKTIGLKVLPGGKIETTGQGMGKVLGMEATTLFTGVGTPMPNGVFMVDGDGLMTTTDGDPVMVKITGIGWTTGKGWKASYRGASYQMTQAVKLASLNKTVGVYELETDENGDFDLKIWAWK
jgi:hypothetical protein